MMKTKYQVRFGLLSLAACFTTASWADPITVAPSGGDYTTIQAAITAANSGDTILVADGTYNENLNVTKALTLKSVNGSGAVTIQGSAAQSNAAGGGNVATVCISANAVSIGTSPTDGFTIVGYDWAAPAIEHAAIYLKPGASTGLAVIGNNIVADGEGGLLGNYGLPQEIEVAHNTFSGKTYVGDSVGGNSSVQWTVHNVPRSMIYFSGACTNISFHDNLVGGSVGGVIGAGPATYYNTGATIDCNSATSLANGAVISNNTFTVPSWAALRARGPFTTVTGNTFDSSAAGGLTVGTSYSNTANDVYSGNIYLSGAGTSFLGGDGSSTVVLPGDYASYTMASVTTPAGTSIRATGLDRTVYMAGQATSTFDDQTVTLASLSLPVVRPVPAGYATIQAAITAALPGETVEVASGSYSENLSIAKAITLVGPNADISAVTGTRSAEAEITGTVTVTADNVTIDGFSLTNPTGTVGIYAKRFSGLTVENNIIHDINSAGTGSASGVYVLGHNTGSGNIPIQDITITGNHIHAIGSLATTVSVKGIYLGDSDGSSTVSNVLVQGNRVEDVSTTRGAYGISINYGVNSTGSVDNVRILDNIVTNLEGLWVHGIGLETDTTNTVVQGNDLSDLRDNKTPSDAVGIFFEGNPSGASVVISNNILRSSMGWGVAVHPADIAAYGYSVDASANYWDSTDGPSGEGSGTGIPTGPNVGYNSYYADAAFTNLVSSETWVDDDFTDGTPGWGLDHFATVQEAIPATLPGGTVNVAAGTYTEQVEITAPVVIQGAGQGSTVIKGFASMPLSWMSSAANVPIVYIHGTNGVALHDLTIDGDGQGNTNYRYQGIGIVDGGATVEDVTVTGVRDTPFSGNQHGVAIYGYNTDGTDRDVVVRNCTITDFQKNAIALNGPNAVVLVEGCTVTGAGPTGVTAQNGIQVWDPSGIIRNNTVSEIKWTGGTWTASGILVYDSSDITVEGNTVTNCQTSIYATAYLATPQNLTITGNTVTGADNNYIVGYDGVTLDNNSFSQSVLGLNIYNTSNVAASDNTYDGCEVGLWIDGASSSVAVTDDTYTGNTTAGAIIDPDATNVSITGSTFTGNTAGLLNVSGTPVTASPNWWGAADGPSGEGPGTGDSVGPDVAYSPWWADAAMTTLAYDSGTFGSDYTVERGETLEIPGTLSITGGTFLVDGGTLLAGDLDLQPGATLNVVDGQLTINGSTLSGSFTFFNSMGSVDFNGDVSITGSAEGLILVCDVHVADGATITVDGTLVIDGCVVDSTGSYTIDVNSGASFTMARTVVVNGTLTIGADDTKIYDSRFVGSTIEVTAGTTGAAVYHNIDASLTDNGTGTVTSVDGWGNLADPGLTENNLVLNLDLGTLTYPTPGRTINSAGDVFVQSGDAFSATLDVSDLQAKISAVEVLLGYNTDMLAASSVALEPDWDVYITGVDDDSSVIGKLDTAIGLSFDFGGGGDGIDADDTIASVALTAGALEGETTFFHRVKLATDTFGSETRLTTGGASPSYLTPFTLNSGTIVIDNSPPEVIVDSLVNATQVQVNEPSPVDVLDPWLTAPPAYVFRNGNPLVITFTAQDTGLAGLDADDAANDVFLVSGNGAGTSLYSFTVDAAIEDPHTGIVTYTVTLPLPVDAENGTYQVFATVRDRSGNYSANAPLGTFQIANELVADVQLQGFTGGPREVTFTATNAGGAVLKSWTKSVSFTGDTGSVGLEDVPAATANISAKTAWNLRSKVTATFTPEGVATANLTGADKLPGGDLTGDNVVNTLDYSLLRYYYYSDTSVNISSQVANINGDNVVNNTDYVIMNGNFYTAGDAE